jgi:hypothetical protein
MMGIRPSATDAASRLNAKVRGQSAGEHGQDEDPGADAKLCFELHGFL